MAREQRIRTKHHSRVGWAGSYKHLLLLWAWEVALFSEQYKIQFKCNSSSSKIGNFSSSSANNFSSILVVLGQFSFYSSAQVQHNYSVKVYRHSNDTMALIMAIHYWLSRTKYSVLSKYVSGEVFNVLQLNSTLKHKTDHQAYIYGHLH